MEPCTKNTNTQKRKHFLLNLSSVFSTWHLAGSDIISHLMLKSQQLATIPKIARYHSKRSYHFSAKSMKWPLQQSEITQLTSFASTQSKLLSYDSCLRIAVIAFFFYSWDNFFRTAVIAFLEQLWQLTHQLEHYWFFHIWLKSKPTIVTTFFLAKILFFSATFSPATLTWNSKNTLKLNIPFLAKSWDGFSEDSLLFEIDFGWYSLLK